MVTVIAGEIPSHMKLSSSVDEGRLIRIALYRF